MRIKVQSPIEETPRVLQVRGIFDLQEAKTSHVEWDVDMPLGAKPWNIGLILGPSGSGKTTIAKALWPNATKPTDLNWPARQSVLDAFPQKMPIKAITEILSCVGFSSPPAWLRPFHVLSNGQQFRVTLALLIANWIHGGGTASKELGTSLMAPAASKNAAVAGQSARLIGSASGLQGIATAEAGISDCGSNQWGGLPGNGALPVQHHSPIVFDEYSSVVDRNVAKIGSAALAKVVRARGAKFVAVTCHEDVEEWLNPDWVYRPAEQTFAWRSLRRRPIIPLEVFRCDPQAWRLFAPHHYLSDKHNSGAVCFMATWGKLPVAYSSWLTWFGAGPPTRREHRTVTLPDFQGVGIGNKLSDLIAGMWKAHGLRATSTTTHPAMIRSRLNSPNWKMVRSPGLLGSTDIIKHASNRLTAGFEYVGPAMPKLQAQALYGKRS